MSASRWPLALAVAAGVALCGARGEADAPEETGAGAPEILHIPQLERRAEQGILTPVPVAAELPRDVAVRARRVLMSYRLWGDPDWTTLELVRSGARYEGAIPCLEISTVTGDLRYYIRVHDVEGRVIATGASRAKPYLVTIKHDSTLAPGAPRTAKCPDPADCPRGLPGCPSERVIEIACQADSDCEGGMTCGWRGVCERQDRRKNWIQVSVEQDIGVVSTTGACSVYAQENEGYACYRADGAQYIGNPVLTNEPLGVGRGPTRVVVGYERLVHYDTSFGVRLGFAFGQGPTPRDGTEFVPLSVAARVTHWFGDDPFARSGLRWFAFVTGGYGMVDVATSVRLREDPTAAHPYQAENDLEQTADVWKRSGDAFVGGGGGLAFAWSAGRAAVVEVAALEAFPFAAFVIAPSVGVMVGF